MVGETMNYDISARSAAIELRETLLGKARKKDPDAEGDVFVGHNNTAYWVNPRTGNYRLAND